MFKKDSYWVGLLLGALAPVIFYGLLYSVDMLIDSYFGMHIVKENHYLILLSVIPNILLLRYYLGKQKFTKTGLSLLLLTIVFVLLYFFNYFQNPQ